MTIIPKMPNIDLNPHDWEEVERILRTHVPEYEVWAFGSRVKWTAKAYSDLDLAIISNQPLSLSTIASLKDAFDESTLAIKVDVVDWATTSESFRQIIENGKVLIQAASTATENWSFRNLIECTRDGNLSYGIVQPGQHVQNGIPIVRVNNFNNGRLYCDDVMRVSPDIEKKYKRTRLEGGEVLLTLVGTTGQSAVVPKEMAGWNIARAVAVIRPKPEVGANWINICLQTKDVQQFLDERANTTVQKTLNLGDVREIPIPIPPEDIKENIEAIYLALTNKIELNRQINQTLEQIAQAIFKSWFVDFEPVKAKIEAKTAGRDPERAAMCAISGKSKPELDQLNPEQYRQLAATAALFPDELVESELGLIPKRWEVGNFEKCCVRVESGGTPSRTQPEYWNGSVPWLTSGEVRDVIVLDTKEKISAKGLASSSAKLWPAMSTVVAMYGATAGQICLIANEMAANQACCALIPKNEYQGFVFFSARRSIEDLAGKASGSAQQNLNKSLVANHLVITPPDKVANIFETTTAPLIQQWIVNQRESQALATLRDTLLPKILSGELSVDNLPLEATA